MKTLMETKVVKGHKADDITIHDEKEDGYYYERIAINCGSQCITINKSDIHFLIDNLKCHINS